VLTAGKTFDMVGCLWH